MGVSGVGHGGEGERGTSRMVTYASTAHPRLTNQINWSQAALYLPFTSTPINFDVMALPLLADAFRLAVSLASRALMVFPKGYTYEMVSQWGQTYGVKTIL